MNNIIIRKVNTDYLIALQQIGRKTFSESNSKANMEKYRREGYSEEKLLNK